MKVELVKIISLKSDSENARTHSERNIKAIAASLQDFGQRKPVVVHGDVVIAGNGTLEAAQSLGWTEIVVTKTPDDWTMEQARAFALVDNRTAELAEWNQSLLVDQLVGLEGYGFDLTDYGFATLDDSNNPIEEDTSPQLGETKYAVIIDCDDELQQFNLLERFATEGLRARSLSL